MTAIATTIDRESILQEINELETRLAELRAALPTAIKSFFRFRCHPERSVWVYALTRDEAERKLHARMNASYGNQWSKASNVVDHYKSPTVAAVHSPGSLLRALGEADAHEFIADYRDDQKGRVDDPSRPKNLPKSQLEQDVDSYEAYLRRRDSK